MERGKRYAALVFILTLMMGWAFSAQAVRPDEVIFNEVYFNLLESTETNYFEAVELLVVKSGLDLNGLQISDRDAFDQEDDEGQCILQDLGQGFLTKVPAGTLIVIYIGTGTDDVDSSDYVMRFYAQSSVYCNAASKAPLRFADAGDNLHLLHLGKQVDFLKYHSKRKVPASPGKLTWENGAGGSINVGGENENVGFRFLGDKPDLNNFLAAWIPYRESYLEENNLGKPNGGKNTAWIEALRKKK